MMKQPKWWLLAIGALLLFAGGIWYAFFGVGPGPVPEQETALVEFKGADLQQEENGELIWKLSAKRIMMNPKTRVLYLEEAEALFSDGPHQIHVQAKKGEVDHMQKTVRLMGSVEIRSDNDTYVKVNNLLYDGETGKLTATDGIRLERNGMVLTGDNLVADRALRQATVSGNVRLVKGEDAH